MTIWGSILIVPSVPFIPSKGTPLPNWLKSYLKEVFLKNTTESNEYEKVYISRSKASIRRMINENELTAPPYFFENLSEGGRGVS